MRKGVYHGRIFSVSFFFSRLAVFGSPTSTLPTSDDGPIGFFLDPLLPRISLSRCGFVRMWNPCIWLRRIVFFFLFREIWFAFSDTALFWEVGLIFGYSVAGWLVSEAVSPSSSVCSGVFFLRPGVASAMQLASYSIFFSLKGKGEI